VNGKGRFDRHKAEIALSAGIQTVDLRHAARAQPVADLEIGDDAGAGTLGDADGIADMIAVPVRNQDVFGGNVIGRGCPSGLPVKNGSMMIGCPSMSRAKAECPSQVNFTLIGDSP